MTNINTVLDSIWRWVERLVFDYGVFYAAVIIVAIYVIVRAILSGLSRTAIALISAIPTIIVVYCLLRWLNII